MVIVKFGDVTKLGRLFVIDNLSGILSFKLASLVNRLKTQQTIKLFSPLSFVWIPCDVKAYLPA